MCRFLLDPLPEPLILELHAVIWRRNVVSNRRKKKKTTSTSTASRINLIREKTSTTILPGLYICSKFQFPNKPLVFLSEENAKTWMLFNLVKGFGGRDKRDGIGHGHQGRTQNIFLACKHNLESHWSPKLQVCYISCSHASSSIRNISYCKQFDSYRKSEVILMLQLRNNFFGPWYDYITSQTSLTFAKFIETHHPDRQKCKDNTLAPHGLSLLPCMPGRT